MAQSNSLIATITKASGSIQVSRNGQIIELNEGDSIYTTDIINTGGSSAELSFTNGAVIMLGAATNVAFSTEDASLVLNLNQGTIRSISNANSEQNFEAFKLVTPKGNLDMDGADIVYNVSTDGSEGLYIVSIPQGKEVVFINNAGQQITLTDAGQGVQIAAGNDTSTIEQTFSSVELTSIVNNAFGSLGGVQTAKPDSENNAPENNTLAEGENNQAESAQDSNANNDNAQAPDGVDTNQNVLIDQSLLGTLGQQNEQGELGSSGLLGGSQTSASTPELGFNTDFDTGEAQENTSGTGGSSFIPSTRPTDSSASSPNISINGDETFFGDQESVTSGTASFAMQNITITQDMTTTDVIIAGDALTVRNADVTAASDTISGLNMTTGIVVGDVHTVQNATISFGDDDISFSGDVGANAKIYGDYVTGATGHEGGDDSISIGGVFSGEIFAGGGADSINITHTVGGRVDLGANDNAFDSLNLSGGSGSITIINFDTNTDELIIDGVKQHLVGDDNYEGIDITFIDTLGNVNPTFDVPSDAKTLADGNAISIVMQNAHDANGDAVTFETPAQTTYGTVSVINASTGEFSYIANNNDPRIQILGQGHTLTDSFDVSIKDGFGGITTKTVTVTIVGVNDALSVTATEKNAATEAGVSAGNATASGKISISDLDKGDAYSFNIGGLDISLGKTYYVMGSEATGFTLATSTTANNHVGTIVFSGSEKDYNYSFSLNNAHASIDGLAQGTSLNIGLDVSASDVGSNDNASINITINGTNDAPLVKDLQNTTTITEGNHLVTGNVSAHISDVDSDNQGISTFKLGASVTINGATNSVATPQAGGDIFIQGIYGNLTISGIDGSYNYALGSSQEQIDAFKALGGSTSKTETFTLYATDAHNATGSGELTFTVKGSNEAPTLSITDNSLEIYAAGVGKEIQADNSIIDSAGPNQAFNGIVSANHSVTTDDVDIGDTLNYVVVPDGILSSGTHADYGTLSFNGSSYSFELADNSFVRGLNKDDSITLRYKLQVSDGTDFDEEIITVTINGTNDKPALSLEKTTLNITHNDLSFDDNANGQIDGGEAVIVSGTASFADMDSDNYGNVAGDGKADNPIGAEALKIYVVEGDNSNDDESGPALSGVANLQSVSNPWGRFSINTDPDSNNYGQYTFELDNDSTDVIGLSNGQLKTLYYTIYVQDAHGAWTSEVITVEIKGIDDAPEITVNASPTNPDVTEDTDNTAEGTIKFVDPDGGNNTVDIGGVTIQINSTTYYVIQDADSGNFTLTEDSSVTAQDEHLGTIQFSFGGSLPITYNYTFTLNNANATINALNEGVGNELDINLKIEASTASSAVTEQTLNITVNGANDAPIVTHTPESTTNITDDDDPTKEQRVTGSVTAHDAENGSLGLLYLNSENTETSVGADTVIHGKYGSLRINLSGDYTYTLGGSLDAQKAAVIALDEDQSEQDTFTFYTRDSNGVISNEESVIITITGVDNAPTISVTKDAGTDNEIIAINMKDAVVSGIVTIADPDSALIPSYTVTSSAGGDEQLSSSKPGTIVNEYGIFSIAPTADGVFTYKFVLDIGSATVQALGDGGRHTLDYTITAGGVSNDVSIIIFGGTFNTNVTTNDGSLFGKDGNGEIASDAVSDILIIDGNVSGTVLADASKFTGTGNQQGGDDFVQITGNLSDSALIIGDIQNDDTPNTSFLLAGEDYISVTGIMSAGTIVGDSYVYNAATYPVAVGNDDVISVGQMTGGIIYGDNSADTTTADGGDDIITITTGNMEGSSAINGGGGNDIITITTGNMQGSSAINGGGGNDVITISKGYMQEIASIDAGNGNDTITIAKFKGGTVNAGADNDTINANITNIDPVTHPVIDLTGDGDDILNLTVDAENAGNFYVTIVNYSADTITVNGTEHSGSTNGDLKQVTVDADTNLFIYFA